MLLQVPPEAAGERLDQYLQRSLPEWSRSRLQSWIKRERVRVNGAPAKPSLLLRGGEAVEVEPEAPPRLHGHPEDIPLNILYADDDVIAVDKPAGMVVHAGAGRHTGTLVNALLHHFGSLSSAGGEDRPGIVHRIDRETSGVLLVARNDAAHRSLAEQFASRTVEKIYLALVQGVVRQDTGTIDLKIARDPVRRIRMTTRLEQGRTAITRYRVLRRFAKHTFVEVRIGTGRTHQIRVHMASIGHPVAGDALYGAARTDRGRFFLHAHRLTFDQPRSGERIKVESPLPHDLTEWLQAVE